MTQPIRVFYPPVRSEYETLVDDYVNAFSSANPYSFRVVAFPNRITRLAEWLQLHPETIENTYCQIRARVAQQGWDALAANPRITGEFLLFVMAAAQRPLECTRVIRANVLRSSLDEANQWHQCLLRKIPTQVFASDGSVCLNRLGERTFRVRSPLQKRDRVDQVIARLHALARRTCVGRLPPRSESGIEAGEIF